MINIQPIQPIQTPSIHADKLASPNPVLQGVIGAGLGPVGSVPGVTDAVAGAVQALNPLSGLNPFSSLDLGTVLIYVVLIGLLLLGVLGLVLPSGENGPNISELAELAA